MLIDRALPGVARSAMMLSWRNGRRVSARLPGAKPNVGAGLPAMAIGIYTTLWVATANGNHDAKRAALDLDLLLISGAPLNHA
ncbi:hypothetical protein, partial [Pseudomonas lactis]|uniref:hypothetical protein n=1 Tax=Pseudomonas lactis TaxID=1615674 RepID=UPI003F7E3B16